MNTPTTDRKPIEDGFAIGTVVQVYRDGVPQYRGTVVGYWRGAYVVREFKFGTTCNSYPFEVEAVQA